MPRIPVSTYKKRIEVPLGGLLAARPDNIYYIILGIASIFQGLALGLSLVRWGKGPRNSNYLLASWLFVSSYFSFILIMVLSQEIRTYDFLIQTQYPFVMAWGPLLFFYVRSLFTKNDRIRLKDAVHFLPALLGLFLMMPVYFGETQFKIDYQYAPEYLFQRSMNRLMAFCVTAFYVAMSYMMVRHFEKMIKNNLSDLEDLKITWIKRIIYFSCLVMAVSLGIIFTKSHYLIFYGMPTALFILMFGMAYSAFTQSSVVKCLSKNGLDLEPCENPQAPLMDWKLTFEKSDAKPYEPRYAKSGLTSRQVTFHKDRLLEYLAREKPYLNGGLKVYDIAKYLGLTPYQVSQVINVGFGKPFYDLVNEYRIMEAKKRLMSPEYEHQTILSISEDVGFKSKSTFNLAFKDAVGCTPSAFRGRAS